MNCAVSQEMLGPYIDGELDANSELQLGLHLSQCESCNRTLQRLQVRTKIIRSGGLSYLAPAELEERIRKSIWKKGSLPNWRRWGAIAATLLLAGTFAIRLNLHLVAEDQLAQQAISSHVRAMMTGHTIDVISTDQHTVKPWFNGRIDFSPPVTDLATQGFPLVGGRVDYLDGRVAATLVYQRKKHVIDLFIWPTRPGDGTARESSRGFNVIQWSGAGMSFLAISDLNKPELEQFRNLLRAN